MQSKEHFGAVIAILYYILLGAVGYFFVRYVFSWMLPLFLGVGIAALLRPATRILAQKTHMREKYAATLTLFFFYLAAAGLFGLFLTLLLAQLYELLEQLPTLYAHNIAPLLTRVSGWLYDFSEQFNGVQGGLERFSEAVSGALRQTAVDGSARLVAWGAGIAAKLPLLLLASVFTVMISVLTAIHYPSVGAAIYAIIPKRWVKKVRGLERFGRETLGKLARAYTILFAVTFTELTAGLWLLQFEYVLPVAAAIALLDILPLIGAGTILIPWGLVLLAGGDPAGGIGLLILFGLIEVVRNILEPRVVGGQIGLHPIITITAMYAGLRIAGFLGMLLAPITVLLLRYLLIGDSPAPHSSPDTGV